MFQVPNQKTFLLMGKNETTVVNFRDADEVLLTTCILSFGCKCCCWSKHLQCLIVSSHDAHLMFCKLLITEKDVNVEVFKRMQVSSSPGCLRNITAVGRFILCNFDAPLEENIRTDITQSSGISASQKADKIGTNNLNYMLNYTAELLSRAKISSSSSMVRVFQVDDYDIDETSLSSPLGLAEVACTALDDVILSDLTTTWELSATKFLVVVGSSRCSSLAVFFFDGHKPGFELVDSRHFQGQKVRGVSMEGGRLFCLTTERQVGEPFLFLSLGCHGDACMRLLTFAITGADTIPKDNDETKYNHNNNNNNNNEDINTTDDEDDDFELDESNFIIPGVFPPAKVERGRLVEEVEDQNEGITITAGNDGNNFVCIHCGKTNSANQELPAHHHGNVDLESLVTKMVQRELKKFKDEILCDLKSLILSEFQKK